MSDEERDIDVESDDDDADQEKTFTCLADKRAHHNALERKRRDHIKDSFCSLRDSIPSLQGEKHVSENKNSQPKASRAQILNKATDYIQFMRRKNHTHQADIDELKRQNMILDQQVRQLEKARATGNLSIDASTAAILSSDPTLLAIPPPTEGVLNDNNITAENIGSGGFVSEETNGNDNSKDDYQSSAKRLKMEN